jgi:superfamily II DNA/RNA helicase
MRVMHDNGARVQKVQIATPEEQHANIRQELYWADSPEHKRRLLDYWLRDPSIDQAIVFACTQVECEQLAEELQQANFAAVALHGALSQAVRNRRLGALREGRVQILVATDVAARGIDVPTITHVINFGLPMKAEDYTHRIGRTGRAGRDGLAVTLAEIRDRRRLADIEGHTRQPFKPLTIDGLEPTKFYPPIAQDAPGRKGAGRGRPAGRGAPRGGPRSGFGDDRRGPRMVGGGFGEKSGDGARRTSAGSSHFGSAKPGPTHAKHGGRPAARNGAPQRAAKPYAPKVR